MSEAATNKGTNSRWLDGLDAPTARAVNAFTTELIHGYRRPTGRSFLQCDRSCGPARNAVLVRRDEFGREVERWQVVKDGASVAPFNGAMPGGSDVR